LGNKEIFKGNGKGANKDATRINRAATGKNISAIGVPTMLQEYQQYYRSSPSSNFCYWGVEQLLINFKKGTKKHNRAAKDLLQEVWVEEW